MSNNEKVVRKAVELADGFRSDDRNKDRYWGPLHFSWTDDDNDELTVILMDALAAQLVRQVDALNGYSVLTAPEVSHVVYENGAGGSIHRDSDRTMNTIKAIVDSGVLE